MKIAFPIITAGTGSDVYFQRIHSGLYKAGIYSEIVSLDYRYEFIPGFHKKILSQLNKFDIIHSNGEYGYLFEIPGKPLVITLHHNIFDKSYQNFTSMAQKIYHYVLLKKRIRKSISRASFIIFVSNAARESFMSTFPTIADKKYCTIYNGIDIHRFTHDCHNKNNKNKFILFVGTLSKRKGADLLEPIMEDVHPSFRLRCVTRSNGYKHKFHSGRIDIINNADESKLISYYRESKCFLFPSRLEGFGLAVAEAMSCGLPVVATNYSSLPELVVNGKGGYLCAPGNAKEFATRINELASSPALRREMGEFNRARVEQKFTLERMINEYKELFEKVLSTAGV